VPVPTSPLFTVEMIVPKLLIDEMSTAGNPYWARLKGLNDSARNWGLYHSAAGNGGAHQTG
jgi:hypothetical protein